MPRWYSPRTSARRKLAPATYISKQDAEAKGLLTYWDGLTCAKHHLAAKYVHNDKCVHCERAKAKAPYVGGKPYKRLL